MSASLAARVTGKVSQYGVAGTLDSDSIVPRDSGTILGTIPPGQAGLKQTSGVIQDAADLTVGVDANGVNQSDNFLESSPSVGNVPTVNAAQDPENGLSLSPQHE